MGTSEFPDSGASAGTGAIRRYFAQFARDFAHLPLYGRLAERVVDDEQVASLLTSARPGQERPVLLFAALHDLVLRDPDVPVASWYRAASRGQPLPGDPWPAARATLLGHADEVRRVVASRTVQTNEVNRSVYVAAMTALACADLPDVPVVLVELGASAGLLLNADRYRIVVDAPGGSTAVGEEASPVQCRGRVDGPVPTALPRIAARYGLDPNPVAHNDPDALRWLRACLWPDVADRVSRFEAAVQVLREHPPTLLEGDATERLAGLLERLVRAHPGHHVVVFSSWMMTYVERSRRGLIADAVASAAHAAPVSWWTAEPADAMPGLDAAPEAGDTVLGLQRWRGTRSGGARLAGYCHPHGEWVRLSGEGPV